MESDIQLKFPKLFGKNAGKFFITTKSKKASLEFLSIYWVTELIRMTIILTAEINNVWIMAKKTAIKSIEHN